MTTSLHLQDQPVRETRAAHDSPSPNQADRVRDSEKIRGRRKTGGNNLEVVLILLVSIVLTIFGMRLVNSEDQKELDSAKTELPQ